MDLPAPTREDDRQRRADARVKGLNGIEYVEVAEDERVLRIVFSLAPPASLEAANFSISGGVRVRGIRPVDLRISVSDDTQEDMSATLTVDHAGDFSVYTLAVSGVDGFDQHYSQCAFTFRTSTTHLDCRAAAPPAAPEQLDEPEIDYLTKDYGGFRQLLLNRLALIMPDWTETHVPDVGTTLVEILAYAGDYLSYYQDAVATEAYLNTARRRISVRRHVRLVDYAMHEGCNARTWVCMATAADLPPLDPADCTFVTECGAFTADTNPVMSAARLQGVSADQYEAFQPVGTTPLAVRAAHGRMSFYAWGARQYVLPVGTTTATLVDAWAAPTPASPASAGAGLNGAASASDASGAGAHSHASGAGKGSRASSALAPASAGMGARALANLKPGDWLAIEEVCSPVTGAPADADPLHRCVVCLTAVEATVDPVYDQPIVNVAWAAADALPFKLVVACLSPPPECAALGAASGNDMFAACANVFLADHGSPVRDEALDDTGPGVQTTQSCEDEGLPGQVTTTPGTYRPRLKYPDLTFRVAANPATDANTPAAGMLTQDASAATASIALRGIAGTPDGSGPLFTFSDLADPSTLALHLKSQDDDATAGLRRRLSHHLRQSIEKLDDNKPVPPALLNSLRRELEPLVVQWSAQPDLLASGPLDAHYVVEIDDDRAVQLRFGDGQAGQAPTAGSVFSVDYRVGNGQRGNVGHDSIAYLVLASGVLSGGVTRVWNPLPAVGGVDPESLDEVRIRAPSAFRNDLARAISADDYARIAERHADVREAAATLRWMGSRYAVKVAIAPWGSEDASTPLLDTVARYLEQYRRIGHDVEVTPATYVPLDIELTVRVAPDYVRRAVAQALFDALSARTLPGATGGFFYPDQQRFGEDVHASVIIGLAQRVEGVMAVTLSRFERLYEGANGEIESGVLRIRPQEIPQLDNTPNFPERGRLKLIIRGGR